MRALKLLIFIIAIALLCGSAYAETGVNLVANGDFSETGASGIPASWYQDMWYRDEGISRLTSWDDGYDGACAMVLNADENDARLAQVIAVKPDTLYMITAKVKAQSVGEGEIGANISIVNTFSYSDSLFDTGGEWETLTLYGKTGDKQTEVILALRVGGYGALNNGRAWFDDVTMTEIDELPEGVVAKSFATLTPSGNNKVSEENVADAEPARHTEAWLLMTCAYVLIVIAVIRKRGRLPENIKRRSLAIILILGAALLIRFIVAFKVRGYNVDVSCFTLWSERIFTNGLSGFYEEGYHADYPPGYMLLLYPVALIRRMFGAGVASESHVFMVKLLPMLLDIVCAYVLYVFARKRAGERTALILMAFMALNPAVIADSAAWGQIDMVFTLVIALCAIFVCDGRYQFALPAFALAALIKPQALLVAPLGLLAIALCVCKEYKSDKGALKRSIIGLAVALAGLYLIALPFCFKNGGMLAPFTWYRELYGETMSGYQNITVNALNLYYLLGLNWTSLAEVPDITTLAWVLFALSYLISFMLYAFARDKNKLFLIAGVLMTLIYCFGPMIHERYLFPALILLAFAYADCRDKRILISLVTLTATLFLNEVLVLQGGMTQANFGHLQASEQWLNSIVSVVNMLNALFITWTGFDICILKRVYALAPEEGARQARAPMFIRPDSRLRLKRIDYLLMAGVTLIYSCVAFTNLGSTVAPQSSWISSISGEQVEFELGDVETFNMTYYGGICNTNFTVEFSNDGEVWTQPYDAAYDQGEIFRWLWFAPHDGNMNKIYKDPGTDDTDVNFAVRNLDEYPKQTAKYVRITAESAGLILSEVGFLNENGEPLDIVSVTSANGLEGFAEDPMALIDEQAVIPEYPSYFNSTYFDEIYHARTAYEHLHGLSTYETTHPPLGKVIMMLGIQMFGMTPFGWRFMGTLVGVLMLPVMYMLAKQLVKRTDLSFIAMFLLAVDSMHFTQTRIATIDSYAVFFIMLMYLCMFKYMNLNWNRDGLKRTLIPLGLSGIFMGLAWASKWIGLYASIGLAALFFYTLYRRWREYTYVKKNPDEFIGAENVTGDFKRNMIITLAFCVIMFIIIPALIYYFSYYWQMQYEGGLTVSRVFDRQLKMFDYHAGLGGDTHYYRSEWFEWPIIWWPMWYYSGSSFMPANMVSSISCMGNPIVWWAGLIALIFITVKLAWSKKAPRAYMIVLIGFLSQYLPWVLVPRSTFIYHYFASVPFIILATVLMLEYIRRRSPKAYNVTSVALLGSSLIMFAGFYPLESGMPAPRSYVKWLRWFKWFNY